MASCLLNLGSVLQESGELVQARESYRKALEIWDRRGSEEWHTAEVLRALGTSYRQANRPEEALGYYQRALDVAERQIGKLGGTEGARRRLAAAQDRIQQQIADLDPETSREEIDILLTELLEVRREREGIIRRIRRDVPQIAALQHPQPLDLKGTRQALDPGTVMLSYSVGDERTLLFAVTRDSGLEVYSLPVDSQTLSADVNRFRDLIQHPLWSRQRSSFMELSRRLYKTLIEPAADVVASCDRVLIVPDGPLHVLAWSALVRDTAPDKAPSDRHTQYLVEWKPLHSVQSATVYAQFKKSRRSGSEPGGTQAPPLLLVAFGAAVALRDPGVRALLEARTPRFS